jgi:hypothetical protein
MAESQTVGKSAQSVQSHVGDDPRATRFHHYAIGRSNLHLGSALLFGESGCLSNSSFHDGKGFSVNG